MKIRTNSEEEENVAPEERARKLLYNMIMDSQLCSADDKKYLIKSVALPEVRSAITDLFQAFATPRKI
jgi:hypothetical protein